MKINIPDYANKAINLLEESGFEAYCVGGCVRDSILKKDPNDWDICTNALPEQMQKVFADFHTIETGLKHGTITVIINRNPVEITTYRTDGEYQDHRKPTQVSFIKNLSGDLERRDFTINSMCYNPKLGFVDLFSGYDDISNKIIRCVGNAEYRFEEDALRILRALRFSSVLNFEIDIETKSAIYKKKNLLTHISSERIFSELKKLLCGKRATEILMEYKDVFAIFIPEIIPCFDFTQNNPHHIYDVWEHICRSISNARPDPIIRLTMLLHDIEKPALATTDENGINHFKKHQYYSAMTAEKVLKRMHCDNGSIKYIYNLVWEHDNRIPIEKKSVRRFISKYSFEFFMDYLEVRRADTYAQSNFQQHEKLRELDQLAIIAFDIFEDNDCLKISDLAVNGNDMISLGLSGEQIGNALSSALDAVISEEITNTKEEIIKYITQ